jgi:hypothetical protein
VNAADSDSVLPTIQADRRPAIWPWLVMPIITLTLFYCLDQLRRAQEPKDFGPTQVAAHESTEDR